MSEHYGSERRKYVEPIHPWRWRGLSIWIVAFTVAVGWGIHETWSTVHELKQTKAGVIALEHTDCALKKFLISAKVARIQSANHEKGKQRLIDLAAARAYHDLAETFDETPNCAAQIGPVPPTR